MIIMVSVLQGLIYNIIMNKRRSPQKIKWKVDDSRELYWRLCNGKPLEKEKRREEKALEGGGKEAGRTRVSNK